MDDLLLPCLVAQDYLIGALSALRWCCTGSPEATSPVEVRPVKGP